jgi:aspartyl-tRNA(Asn)/glutamyl-tRNA(Gln) amidotransferase subunit A
MHNRTIASLATGLQTGEFSATELCRHFLARIDACNDTLNCVITTTAEGALEAAQASDDRRANNAALGELDGIPLLHKDVFCTAGVRTTCGSKMLANFVSPYDATVVERLHQRGAVMLGKTNMDEFAMGSTNEHSYFGPARNPWNTEHVPGGSSGGSASAVAAGFAAFATGTDTGGSIRQPAAFCGVTGLKPTYGRVSRYGMVAFASSLDQGGVFARSAADVAPALNAIAGFDPRDSSSSQHPTDDYAANLAQDLRGLRIGVVREHFSDGLDSEVADCVHAAAATLREAGATLVNISLNETALTVPTYYVIALAEASSNLSRFDGARYGHRADNPQSLEDMYERSRSEGFGDEVKRRIMLGTYALSAGYYDAYYGKAQQLRRLITEDFARAFTDVDLILAPTTPAPAFRLGELVDDPVNMYLSDIYTCAINLAGLPALSMPAGQSASGLPIGAQLIGAHFQESRLLNVAHAFQCRTQHHLAAPDTGAYAEISR